MLKLYYAKGACSLASHIALEEARRGIYEVERLDLKAGDQKQARDFLKINPKGRVPGPADRQGRS